MSRPWEEWTDDELTCEAQAGLQGQGALVEAIRRLKKSIDAFSANSDEYSKRMFRLTYFMIGLTVFLAVLASLHVIALLR